MPKSKMHMLYMVTLVALVNKAIFDVYVIIINMVLASSDWWRSPGAELVHYLYLIALLVISRYLYTGNKASLNISNNLFFLGITFLMMNIRLFTGIHRYLGRPYYTKGDILQLSYAIFNLLLGLTLIVIDAKRNKEADRIETET